MTFTDDDLKRLKESWTYWLDHGTPTAVRDAKDFLALITRLEAAENAMSDDCECYEKNCHHEKAYQAWIKASGKGDDFH